MVVVVFDNLFKISLNKPICLIIIIFVCLFGVCKKRGVKKFSCACFVVVVVVMNKTTYFFTFIAFLN